MRYLTIFLLVLSSQAFATKPPKPEAVAQQGQLQGQHQGQTAKGGHAAQQQKQQANNTQAQTIESGAATADGGEASADSDIRIEGDDYKRNAPPVTVISSPSTAEMMVCFGLGGSSTNGAATGAWCRLQRELYATHMGETLASMGLYTEAATAYCSRPMHYRMFNGPGPGEAACRTAMERGYKQRFPMTGYISEEVSDALVAQTAILTELETREHMNAVCDDKLARCEAVVVK